MFYKIECYIEAKSTRKAEKVASMICMDLACYDEVEDHVVVSGPCAAEEAKSAGLLRTTNKVRRKAKS